MNMNNIFDGDFDFLPFRAHVDNGPVSDEPGAFENAVSALRDAEDRASGYITWEVAAARWRVEAVRERRMLGTSAVITGRDVMRRTANALAEWSRA